MNPHPSQERLLELFEYDPEVGSFKRLITVGSNATKDTVIFGPLDHYGYPYIVVDRKPYKSHRLAWIISNGDIPEHLRIDHINRNRSDNRLCNLRLVTHMENCHNQTLKSINTSGYPGVNKKNKKWRARIKANYKNIHLGYFDTKEEAYQAYLDAKKIYHPSAPIN